MSGTETEDQRGVRRKPAGGDRHHTPDLGRVGDTKLGERRPPTELQLPDMNAPQPTETRSFGSVASIT